ncbi:MAG: ATP-dependent DNA helicase [Deltaproteobacteria bacterium]|nr:ATP-dependent DNA helicase [Deltaproteobacteria bacterium]
MTLESDVAKLLGPDGPLSRWSEFEPRPQQASMAREVAMTLDEGSLAIIEAGTGTGKTLAYLLPALLSGKRTVVSTGLINLQEQIYYKDLDFIRKHFRILFTAVILKGRDNYVCMRKARGQHLHYRTMRNVGPDSWQARFDAWLKDTKTGWKEDIPGDLMAALPARVSESLSSGQHSCRGGRCRFQKSCFYVSARRQAANANIVLVNHDLFIADLVIRGGSDSSVIPEWEAAVLDEAHLLSEKATRWFGRSLSCSDVSLTCRQLAEECEDGSLRNLSSVPQVVEICGRLADTLGFLEVQIEERLVEEKRASADERWEKFLFPETNPRSQTIKQLFARAADLCESANMLLPHPKEDEREEDELPDNASDELRLDVFKNKLGAYAETSRLLAAADNPDLVYQFEKSRGDLVFSALPVEGGRILGERLKAADRPVVLTSATLATARTFSFTMARFGFLTGEARTKWLSSPFDYARNTLLFIPEHLPSVKDKDKYLPAFLEEVVPLLKLTKGRALLLFTSNDHMNYVADRLPRLVPYRVLVQNRHGAKSKILQDFTKDVSSVLVATSSFWQGIDVPGESLSTVVVARLPFEVPTSPLMLSRKALVDDRGGNFFNEYTLPQMILSLKQGLGRLLRRNTDRGVLAIFDNRVLTEFFGKKILASLPETRLVKKLDEAREFIVSL